MENNKKFIKHVGKAILFLLGIFVMVLPNFIDLSGIIPNPNILFVIGMLLSFAAVFWFLSESETMLLYSEPDIIYSAKTKDRYDNERFYKSSILEIYNKEESPITSCFATLELADDISVDKNDKVSIFPLIPSLIKNPDKIKWDEERDMNSEWEIEIPADSCRHINLGSMVGKFIYHLRDGDFETNWKLGTPIHAVKIRVDGCFNGKSMKPLNFEGYIYAANLGDARDVFAKNGKVKKKEEILIDQMNNSKMIFKEGNWMSDNDIKNFLSML